MMSAAKVTEDCVYVFEGSDGLRKTRCSNHVRCCEGERYLKQDGKFRDRENAYDCVKAVQEHLAMGRHLGKTGRGYLEPK